MLKCNECSQEFSDAEAEADDKCPMCGNGELEPVEE